MWLRHIDRLERQYKKAFAKDPLFGAELIERIHKRVQVFLYSCNTISIKYMKSGGTGRVLGSTKKGGKREVVDDDAGMGRQDHTKGGRATEVIWTKEKIQD